MAFRVAGSKRFCHDGITPPRPFLLGQDSPFSPNFWVAASLTLTLSSLPTPHQLPTLRMLAIALVPALWLKEMGASLPQASA